jgi:hydroxymethylbilane synthase
MKINVISRKSKLALWQTEFVSKLLESDGHEIILSTMETAGDRNLKAPLAEIGGKGLFTVELEKKLLLGESDIAVHSAKDLQSDLPDNLEIIAFTKREKAHDVLISGESGIDLSSGSKLLRIGTSSVRRKVFLKKYYPWVNIVDVRGNLQTRVKKMRDGLCDALLLAYAGVARMGYASLIVHEFPINQFIPPVGQGTIAVEAAISMNKEKREKVKNCVNHDGTEICLLAERAFLKKMNGGCSIPVFAHALLENGAICLNAGIASLGGEQMIVKEKKIFFSDGVDATKLGTELAEEILMSGGREILEEILRGINKTTA